jgi:hypothetical protein
MPCLDLSADVVQDQVKPVVDEIYNYVLGAKVSRVWFIGAHRSSLVAPSAEADACAAEEGPGRGFQGP